MERGRGNLVSSAVNVQQDTERCRAGFEEWDLAGGKARGMAMGGAWVAADALVVRGETNGESREVRVKLRLMVDVPQSGRRSMLEPDTVDSHLSPRGSFPSRIFPLRGSSP